MPHNDDPRLAKGRELNGWKEIAEYLNRSVRTAQRWERDFELPVRRLRTAAGETVYAVAAELDEWKQRLSTRVDGAAGLETPEGEENREPAAATDVSRPLATTEPSIPAATPATWTEAAGTAVGRVLHSPARLVAWILCGLIALAAVSWIAWRPDPPRDGHGAGDIQGAGEVLDAGPWPTRSRDMRRTGASSLRGPARPGEPRTLYETQEPEFSCVTDVLSLSRNRIVLGECGALVAIDRAGTVLWKTPLVAYGLRITPSGMTATMDNVVLVTGLETPDIPGGLRTAMFAVDGSGGKIIRSPFQGAAYSGPAMGPDKAIYTLDETTYLRAFTPWLEHRWSTALGGFANGGIAVDRAGRLYMGTDGGRVHQHSLWCVRPGDGEVAWRALREDLGLPLVGDDGTIYVTGRAAPLYAFTPLGEKKWAVPAGTSTSLWPLAAYGDKILVLAGNELLAFRPDGARAWRYSPDAGASQLGSMAVDRDGNAYAAFGDLVCSVSPHGAKRWCVPVKGASTVIIADEGLLLATAEARRVVAIGDGPQPSSK